LVIADYKMPQISGIDFINKIREKDTDCKIKTIVISAYIKDNIPYDKSYVMTVDKILEKPVYLDRLKKVVQELISTINIQQKA
jgi:response regulator RpfG family c-di-GMP phosphodiesterase